MHMHHRRHDMTLAVKMTLNPIQPTNQSSCKQNYPEMTLEFQICTVNKDDKDEPFISQAP